MPSAYRPQLNQAKLDELVLYISERNLTHEHFGKTKLHKQLWMSDFRHFELIGEPITGARYIHRAHGPFCADLDAALARLEDAGRLAVRRRDRFGYTQQRPTARERPDLAIFCGQEIAAVEDVLWETWQLSARELSELSHLHPGWAWTKEGEEIGYELALVPINEPLEEPLLKMPD